MLRIPPRESFAEMLEPGDITRVYYANKLTKQNGKGAKKYCIQCFDRHRIKASLFRLARNQSELHITC